MKRLKTENCKSDCNRVQKIHIVPPLTHQCRGVGPGPPVYLPEGVHQVHVGGEGGLLRLPGVHNEERLPTFTTNIGSFIRGIP